MEDVKYQKCRSWFCVWANPQEDEALQNLTPEQMCDKVLEIWTDSKATRTGAVAYCISADGLIHFHMVLCDSNQCAFASIKRLFPKPHIEPTRGTKEQAEDYIYKRGKFEEKGEKVVHVSVHGDLIGKENRQKVFDSIEQMIAEEKTPEQIMNEGFVYRNYERQIKSAFFSKRKKDVPLKRDVKVVWHVGQSGSGKSHSVIKLAENPDIGEEEIYILTDYSDGGLDAYCGEKVLFMDEFRGQMQYAKLLQILDGYKIQVHARYGNIWSLWNEVHLTSVLPPDMVYQNMVKEHQEYDTQAQLFRRIDTIAYHYKTDDGQYKVFEMPMSEYTNIFELKAKATGSMDKDGFMKVEDFENDGDYEQLPLF